MSFASKLQEIRQEFGISQEGLAEMLNVSRQSVSKWERGKGYPEIEKLIHISERFGISLDELLKENRTQSIRYSDSVRERRPISLDKPDSVRERKPISLDKPDSVRERRPIYLDKPEDWHDNVQEIYPNPVTFNHQVASQPSKAPQYQNYSVSPQFQQASQGGRRRRFTKKYRTRIALLILSVFSICMSIGIIIGSVARPSPEISVQEVTSYSKPYYAIDTEDFTEYNIRCMVDESTGIRYVFNDDNKHGIILSSFDASSGIKLRDTVTGHTLYCFDFYYSDNAVLNSENGHTYVIPYYMLSTLIGPDEQISYEVCTDTNTNENYFVPLYITEQCEKMISGENADTAKETDVSEVSVHDEEPDIINEESETPENEESDEISSN